MGKAMAGSEKSLIAKINHAVGVFINWFEVGSLIICVTLLATLLIVNFLARNFFTSIYFAEEISEFLVIFTTFAGLSYGVRKGRHIRMGAFLEMMSPAVEKVFIIIISVISSGVMFYMADASWEYLMHSIDRAHVTPALRLPFWMFYVIIPVGFFMAGVQYLRTIVKNLTEKDTWMSPEQQSEYEDEEVFSGE